MPFFDVWLTYLYLNLQLNSYLNLPHYSSCHLQHVVIKVLVITNCTIQGISFTSSFVPQHIKVMSGTGPSLAIVHCSFWVFAQIRFQTSFTNDWMFYCHLPRSYLIWCMLKIYPSMKTFFSQCIRNENEYSFNRQLEIHWRDLSRSHTSQHALLIR